MKRILVCFLFFVIAFTANSQKVYFVYLQADQEQPFFVKMNGNIYSSSSSGYIILSKLHDGSYNFSIGFPKNKWPEQNFSLQVYQKDQGYLLKNFAEKGWGLFNMQTMVVQMSSAENAIGEGNVKADQKNISVFTDILSKATDDPSLKDKVVLPKVEEKKQELIAQEVVKKEEPIVETKQSTVAKPVETIDQAVVKKEDTVLKEKEIIKTEEEKNLPEESYKRSRITRKSESSTTEGFGLVFIDAYENGPTDTIRILIPNPKPLSNEIKEAAKDEIKFLDITPDTSKKFEDKSDQTKAGLKDQTIPKVISKNKCAVAATENDFLKLRKRMAAETSDDGMIGEAKKYFKTKCFTVSQVKNISSLFLNDAGKYKFFDAAYIYVSDVENFSSLQAELKDDYYINRFKAMLHN